MSHALRCVLYMHSFSFFFILKTSFRELSKREGLRSLLKVTRLVVDMMGSELTSNFKTCVPFFKPGTILELPTANGRVQGVESEMFTEAAQPTDIPASSHRGLSSCFSARALAGFLEWSKGSAKQVGDSGRCLIGPPHL